MTLLSIESATLNCSVALHSDGHCAVLLEECADRYVHAERLHVLIDAALRDSGLRPDAIAVSIGPGSYTGLRIGVSAAKGLAEGYGVPIVAVPTLDQFAFHIREQNPGYDFYVPVIDARRMEVYTRVFYASGNPLNETCALIIDETAYSEQLSAGKVVFFGDAVAKLKDSLHSANAHFLDDRLPNAVGVGLLGQRLAELGQYADVAMLEPYYLKDFIAGIPKKRL